MNNTTHTLPLKISDYKGADGLDVIIQTEYTEESKPGQLCNGQRSVAYMTGSKNIVPGFREETLEYAARIVASWNALSHLSLEQVERLGQHLSNYNGGEIEDMLRDGGV